MKASAAQIRAAVENPKPDTRLYLFHGPDEAGAADLAARLARALGPEAERVDLDIKALREQPGRLADEAASMSLFGGARYIRLSGIDESAGEAISLLLAAERAGNPVIAIGPGLKASGKLVKMAIATPSALAFACYVPEGMDAAKLAATIAREQGLRLTGDLPRRLAAACNGDRARSFEPWRGNKAPVVKRYHCGGRDAEDRAAIGIGACSVSEHFGRRLPARGLAWNDKGGCRRGSRRLLVEVYPGAADGDQQGYGHNEIYVTRIVATADVPAHDATSREASFEASTRAGRAGFHRGSRTVDAAPAPEPPGQIPHGAGRFHGWHIVDSGRAPGLATQQPRQRHPSSPPQSETCDGFIAINRTCRDVTAVEPDQRRQRMPIDPDQRAPAVARQVSDRARAVRTS